MHPSLKLTVIAATLALTACATLPAAAPQAELNRLVEAYFDESLALNPTDATELGYDRFADQLELPSTPEYVAATIALERRYRDAVAAIDPSTLDDSARLTHEMFLYGRDIELEYNRHPWRLLPLSQFDGGLAMVLAVYGSGDSSQPFATVADYDHWIMRASRFPQWVDTSIAAMREGMAQGITHPAS